MDTKTSIAVFVLGCVTLALPSWFTFDIAHMEIGLFRTCIDTDEISLSVDTEYANVSINSIPLVQLMPAKLSKFFGYEGSLTKPPCYESVTWTSFNETIEIAVEKLEDFRTTIFENDGSDGGVGVDISDDFHPVQCMFRRRVYASHNTLKLPLNPVYRVGEDNISSSPNVAASTLTILALLFVAFFRM